MEKSITIDNMQPGQTRTITRTCHVSYTFIDDISYNIRIDYDFSLKKNETGQLYTNNGSWFLYIMNHDDPILLGMLTDMQDVVGMSACMSTLLNVFIKNYYNIDITKNETNIDTEKFDISETHMFAVSKTIENEKISVLLFPDKLPEDWQEKLNMMQLPMEISYNKPYYELQISTTKDHVTRSDIFNIFNEVFNNSTIN